MRVRDARVLSDAAMSRDVPRQWTKRTENGADRGRDVRTTPGKCLTKSITVKVDGTVGDQFVDPAAHIGYARRVVEQHDTPIIEMRNPVMSILNDRFVAVPSINEQVVDRICPISDRVMR